MNTINGAYAIYLQISCGVCLLEIMKICWHVTAVAEDSGL